MWVSPCLLKCPIYFVVSGGQLCIFDLRPFFFSGTLIHFREVSALLDVVFTLRELSVITGIVTMTMTIMMGYTCT